MSQKLILKASGLFTNSNQLSTVPDGALNVATNVVIDKDNIVESRRGYERIEAFGSSSDRADVITSYQDKIIVHRSNDSKISFLSGGTWSDYSGTYSHIDNDLARIRFQEMNGNLYFTSSDGIKMLDAYNGTVYSTGLPQGLDGEATLSGASGFMSDDTQLAYRIVWGSRDVNNNLYLSAPSQRITVSNSTGGTRDVSLTFTIPAGISTADFYQIYRSPESASATSEPNDEMQLVYESNPTSGEITAKSITVIDLTDDSLKGAFLYTNSNQEGIQESNNIPPKAHDIHPFKGFMFFANIETKHLLNLSLISTGGALGLVNNDTIIIDGITFTGKATTTVASREFKIFTAGSVSQNIADTAKELCKVVNQYVSNTSVYAYYVSGYTDLPGQIRIEARSLGDSFSTSVSRATAWNLDNDGDSSNNQYSNGLMWSKIQQPEHVPSTHLELIGSKSQPIRRIVALRDTLFILKDDGVWRLTGENGSWSIEPVDSSTKILAPESVSVLNNQIFALTDQGIVSISDVGVSVLSRPIENQLLEIYGYDLDSVKSVSYGISYETDRKYILNTISVENDTYATQSFVYNVFTRAWTIWDKHSKTGFVSPVDDKIYLCSPTEEYILKERKSYNFSDFADESIEGNSYSIVSFSGTSIVLNTVDDITVGDLLQQSSTNYSVITAIDTLTNTITIYDSSITWSIAGCDILKAINTEVEWVNIHCDNPALDKLFQETSLLFRKKNFTSANMSFFTDLSAGYSDATIQGIYGGSLWGSFPWGSVPWGGESTPSPVRCFIPREKTRGTLLGINFNIRNAFSEWSLNGISLTFDYVSERTNKD